MGKRTNEIWHNACVGFVAPNQFLNISEHSCFENIASPVILWEANNEELADE